LTYSSVAALV